MNRPKSRKLQLDWLSQKKKKDIVKNTYSGGTNCLNDPRFVGKLRKGKVHCSCWLCSPKTKKEGFKPSELRRIQWRE